jgi:hypothetical protein
MTEFLLDKDYTYIVNDKDINYVHIKLLTGEYAETIFKFGKVGIDEKDGNAYLQFDFDVLSSPVKKVAKKIEFRNYIGDLLVSIITSKLDIEEGYYDENRTDDTEESHL